MALLETSVDVAIAAYLDNAKTALAKGDGESAAVFLGGALAEDPAHEEALFLLDGLFARTTDALALSLPDEAAGLLVGETLVRVLAGNTDDGRRQPAEWRVSVRVNISSSS